MSKPLALDIASRLSGQPCLLHPPAVEQLSVALRELASRDAKAEAAALPDFRNELMAHYGYQRSETDKPYAFADGVAVIPVHGILVNRLSWSCSYITGYNFIRNQGDAAMLDPDVETIILDMNTPGGVSWGCAETAARIREWRKEKPVIAVVDAGCHSAGYWLGSAASKIILTPSGNVGSIGAYQMHLDMSKMMDGSGLKVTFVYSGDHKVDGNAYESLSKDVKARMQERVDRSRDEFAADVGKGRPALGKAGALATEAASYDAEEALELKLVDAIASPFEALTVYQERLRDDAPEDDDDGPSMENHDMTTQTSGKPPAPTVQAKTGEAENAPAVIQAPAVTTPVATAAPDMNTAIRAALAEDRKRMADIRNCDEAKGRTHLASHLAEQGMSVADAQAILAAAGKDTVETGTGDGGGGGGGGAGASKGGAAANTETFDRAMTTSGNPNLRPGDGGEGNDGKPSRARAAVGHLGWKPPAGVTRQ